MVGPDQVASHHPSGVDRKIMGVSFAAKLRHGSTRTCSAAWSRCAHWRCVCAPSPNTGSDHRKCGNAIGRARTYTDATRSFSGRFWNRAFGSFMQWGMIPRFQPFGVRSGKAQMEQCFSVSPSKKTYLPILELLPPPALGECRHRGLARRLVAVRRCAIVMVAEHQRPHHGASSGAAVTFMMRGRSRR